VTLEPAPVDHGIVFLREDLPPDAVRIGVGPTSIREDALTRQTTLGNGLAASRVATVEHLLSTCQGLGVDNLLVRLDGPEVPLLDGSALPWVELLGETGLAEQDGERRFFAPTEPVTWSEKEIEITLLPDTELRVTYFADYGSDVVGVQSFHFGPDEDYAKEVAPARTFVFVHEIEALRRANLIKGGSLENALVITDEGYMNGPLRFDNEIARHKALDLLGDLRLLGSPLRGHVLANRSGHRAHALFVQYLASRLRA